MSDSNDVLIWCIEAAQRGLENFRLRNMPDRLFFRLRGKDVRLQAAIVTFISSRPNGGTEKELIHAAELFNLYYVIELVRRAGGIEYELSGSPLDDAGSYRLTRKPEWG